MITTQRLTIRPMEVQDAQFIIELLNEPDFIKYIADKGVKNNQDAIQYMREGPLACQALNGFSLMTVLVDGKTPIGLCGLLKRDNLAYPDLGYAFLERFYRQGFAYEAAQGVLSHFNSIRPLLAITSTDNIPSQQLLLKLGFSSVSNKEEYIESDTALFKFL